MSDTDYAEGVAPAPAPRSAGRRMHKTDESKLLAQARSAAKVYPKPESKLLWSEAQQVAPWPEWAPPAVERAFRRAFAEGLAKRGIAHENTRLVEPGGTGRSAPRGSKASARRLVPGSELEFKEQDAKATAAGLSWSSWARRRLNASE